MLYCLDTILKGALLTLLVGNNTFAGSHIQCEISSLILQNAVHTTGLVTNTWSRSFISVRFKLLQQKASDHERSRRRVRGREHLPRNEIITNAVHTTGLVTNTWSRSFISVRFKLLQQKASDHERSRRRVRGREHLPRNEIITNAVHTTGLVTNTWSRSFISVRCCTVWIRF